MLGQPRQDAPAEREERLPGAPEPTRSTPAVLVALEHLLPKGDPDAAVSRRDVEEYLEDVGVPYRGRAVRLGIAEVLGTDGSAFVRLPGWKISRARQNGN